MFLLIDKSFPRARKNYFEFHLNTHLSEFESVCIAIGNLGRENDMERKLFLYLRHLKISVERFHFISRTPANRGNELSVHMACFQINQCSIWPNLLAFVFKAVVRVGCNELLINNIAQYKTLKRTLSQALATLVFQRQVH